MFVRVAIPQRHAEAIMSRPFLLTAVGTKTRHQGQTKLMPTSAHAKTGQIQRAMRGLRKVFRLLSGDCETVGVERPVTEDVESDFCGLSAGNAATAPAGASPTDRIVTGPLATSNEEGSFQLPFLGLSKGKLFESSIEIRLGI